MNFQHCLAKLYPLDSKELGRRRSLESPEHSNSYVRMVDRSDNNCRTSKAMGILGLAFSICLISQLLGCATGKGYAGDGAPGYFNAANVPNAIPKSEARSRYGNPSSYVVSGKRYRVMASAKGYDKVGYASWYGTKFHGKRTSSYERYDMFSMTGASPTLPIPTYVRVTNLKNNRTVIVKINDRGPFKSSRIVDLSYAAAKKLGYTGHGTALVRVTAIDTDSRHSFFAANDQRAYSESKSENLAAYNISKKQPNVPLKSIQTKSTQLASVKHLNTRYLQVGAFKTRDKAVNLSRKISKLTQTSVAIKESYKNKKAVYQVHIGPLASDAQSDKIKRVLKEHGFEKPVNVAG